MCKGRSSVSLLFIIITACLSVPLAAYGQGGDGRTSVTTPTASRPKARPRRRTSAPKPAPAVPATGSLVIFVNERDSVVLVSRKDGAAVNRSAMSSGSRPMVFRGLEPGRYSVLVKKFGFTDQLRSVRIVPKRSRSVRVSLLPKMSVLNVRTNLPDAEIEIERVGKFRRPLQKFRIKPGKYRLNFRRRGYIPQSAAADLSLPGSEENISVVLQPLRVDTVLARAKEKINAGDPAAAGELTGDVLKLNDGHARANLLAGLAAFHKGELAASAQFRRAAERGEAVTLPVSVMADGGGYPRLTEADLTVGREGLTLRSAAGTAIDVRLANADITEFSRALDRNFVTYIVVGGRPAQRPRQRFVIYSRLAELDTNRAVVCRANTDGRTCSTDIDIIHKLISDWRENSRTASAKNRE